MEEGENGLELFLSAGDDRLGASSTRSHRPDHLEVLGHVHVVGRHQRIVGHRLKFGIMSVCKKMPVTGIEPSTFSMGVKPTVYH